MQVGDIVMTFDGDKNFAGIKKIVEFNGRHPILRRLDDDIYFPDSYGQSILLKYVKPLQPTLDVFWSLAFYGEYDKFVELYESHPIDLNTIIHGWATDRIINAPLHKNSKNQMQLLLYMLRNGAKFTDVTWLLLLKDDQFTDDIVQLVEAGADPFAGGFVEILG